NSSIFFNNATLRAFTSGSGTNSISGVFFILNRVNLTTGVILRTSQFLRDISSVSFSFDLMPLVQYLLRSEERSNKFLLSSYFWRLQLLKIQYQALVSVDTQMYEFDCAKYHVGK